MPSQITNYQCPSCMGPLHYVGSSKKLECDYCGSSFTVQEIDALYADKVEQAQQASAALQWGVAEMTERYKKFADQGVRDLKGYNEKALSQGSDTPEEDRIYKMPQIVIIVDELADLMMVAGK